MTGGSGRADSVNDRSKAAIEMAVGGASLEVWAGSRTCKSHDLISRCRCVAWLCLLSLVCWPLDNLPKTGRWAIRPASDGSDADGDDPPTALLLMRLLG